MQNASNKIIEDAYLKSIKEVLKPVSVDPDERLSDKEVRKKIQEYGKNSLEEQSKRSIRGLIFSQNTYSLIFVTIGLAVAFFVFRRVLCRRNLCSNSNLHRLGHC